MGWKSDSMYSVSSRAEAGHGVRWWIATPVTREMSGSTAGSHSMGAPSAIIDDTVLWYSDEATRYSPLNSSCAPKVCPSTICVPSVTAATIMSTASRSVIPCSATYQSLTRVANQLTSSSWYPSPSVEKTSSQVVGGVSRSSCQAAM